MGISYLLVYGWSGNAISNYQRDKIVKFGVDADSYSNQKYSSWTLTKLYYYDEIWERHKYKIPKRNQFIVFFSTWWNNNCVLIINGDSNYGISLLVYEMPSRKMAEVLERFYIAGSYSNLDSAKTKVRELERIFKGENPILYKGVSRKIDYPPYDGESSAGLFAFALFPFLGRRNHLSSVFPEVKSTILHSDSEKSDLPFSYSSGSPFLGTFASSSNSFFTYSQVSYLLTSKYRDFLNADPDDFIKPLDIIKTSKDKTIHTGIYLGKGKVAHNLGVGIEIANWKDFGVRVGNPNRMTRYHPIIAFKRPEKIIEHIAKCIANSSWRFDIMENNCEHLANMLVYGINYSQQVYERADELKVKVGVKAAGIGVAGGLAIFGGIALAPFTFGTSLALSGAGAIATAAAGAETIEEDCPLNNKKGSIRLADEIKEVGKMLGWKSDSETKQYEKQYLQEVPTKDYCQIM